MSVRKYITNESIVFLKTKEAFGGLSNMAGGYSININDIIIPSAEHLYQACRFPYNPQIQWDIINEKSPMTAKWISRASTHLTRNDWEKEKFNIMQWVIEVKLSQNWHTFGELLRSTGDKNIVEATKKDKIWGAVGHGEYYQGVNALGRLLMYVRDEFVKPNKYNRCVKPLKIPHFDFLGHSIGLVCNEYYFISGQMQEQHTNDFKLI